ncbi:MAG: protein-export chaperone SecB [Alphaproteobacteria bacterium]|nr:protein-export chaperone SecB [Alphaproteobacteria bacterium]
MTDSPTTPTQIQIGLGAQYIKDFSFENPNAPQIFAELQTQPQMSIDVDVMSRALGDGAFESVLRLKVAAKIGEKTAFIAELAYAGMFGLPQQLPEDQLKLFLLVEAPRLLFPFARAVISNAVREAGFPNIIIQPVDFLSLYAAQSGTVRAMQAVGAA